MKRLLKSNAVALLIVSGWVLLMGWLLIGGAA